jgi:NAD(P)-dependent dehydrogenase (short-subunit alcohol dehydrogenase family)
VTNLRENKHIHRTGNRNVTARFIDTVALVTGGGAGIGRAIALALAAEGATVVVAGRRSEPLAQTVKLIEAEGGSASAVPTDITQPDEVAELVRTTVSRHGGLHVAVNNAGACTAGGMITDIPVDEWAGQLTSNLTGTLLSMQREIEHMRHHGGGTIVNLASALGRHLTIPGTGAYATTKDGITALSRTAAREYIREGVRINVVSPGPIDTPMSLLPGETEAERDTRMAEGMPIGRVGRTEEVAAAVLFLAGPESSYVVGHDLVIDGGAAA